MGNSGSHSVETDLKNEELKTLRSRRRLYAGLFIIVLCALLYLAGRALNLLATPVGIIVWTTIIVFCLRGPFNFLDKKGVPRVLGTAIAYVMMFACIVLIGWIMLSPAAGLGDQFTSLLQTAVTQVDVLRNSWNDLYSQYSYILNDERLNNWFNDALASMGTWFSGMASASAEGVVGFGSAAATSALVIGFALVVAYWVLMELPGLGAEIKRLFGPRFQADLNIFYLTGTRVMGGYIKGTVIQCLLIGVGCGIGFAVMGIPNAAALGVITGLLNIIPVVGPWLGGAMAALMGIFTSPFVALLALVYTIVVQQLIYTFVSPKIMGDSVDIHPALVIMALMVGSALGFAVGGVMGNIVGMLASVPLVAAAKALFVYYFERGTGRVIVSPDGVIFKGDPQMVEDVEAEVSGEFAAVASATANATGSFGKAVDVSADATGGFAQVVDPVADATGGFATIEEVESIGAGAVNAGSQGKISVPEVDRPQR